MRLPLITYMALALASAPSLACTFFIATGNAGALVSTSPDGGNMSAGDLESLIQIEKKLLKEVSVLLDTRARFDAAPLLDALVERQNFFSDRANHYWKSYDKARNAWADPRAKEQFFLFNGRALIDLQGILNTIEVAAMMNGGDRKIATRSVTFESLAKSIVFKIHRQLVVLEQTDFSKGVYQKGNPTRNYDALFWDIELSPEGLQEYLEAAKVSSLANLSTRKVKYILAPELQMAAPNGQGSKTYLHPATRQLHLLVPFKTIFEQLQTDQVFIEGVPFRLSVSN